MQYIAAGIVLLLEVHMWQEEGYIVSGVCHGGVKAAF